MTPTSVFDLGRMRHLDLLALWFTLHPQESRGNTADPVGRLTTGHLVKAILAGAR